MRPAIREFLTAEMPGNYDDPETIREVLRLANERFLKPYARTPSFRAEITHSGSPAPGLVGLNLAYRINSPIESFLINVSSN